MATRVNMAPVTFGLLFTLVLLLAHRSVRGRGRPWLVVSVLFFATLAASSGSTLEAWTLLRRHTDLGMDQASQVIDAGVDGLELAAWGSLGVWGVQRVRRG